MMSRKCFVLSLAAALASLGSPLQAAFTFVKVADTSTAIPGSSGNFANFYTNQRVSTDGNTVVFTGAKSSTQVGVYSFDLAGGTLARVADWTTLSTLGYPSVSNGLVGFAANSLGAIYTASTTGTGLTVIANASTAMPGGPGNLASIDVPTLSGGNLVFQGSGTSWSGIYAAPVTGGTITMLVDGNTVVPADSNVFNSPGRPSISGSAVTFNGGYQFGSIIRHGIYSTTVSGGPVTKVANEATIAPGSTHAFTWFYAPATDGTYVAFDAADLATDAVSGVWRYKLDGTGGTVVADKNTFVPGHGTTKFDYFSGVSMCDGAAVFYGGSSSAGFYGIYADANDTLIKIIEKGDALDGKTVSGLQIYDQSVAVSGDTYCDIAFYATFTNGSAGIYVEEVPLATLGISPAPEPATLSLLALGGLAMIRWRGRRGTAATRRA
jgi:hypothetical protein